MRLIITLFLLCYFCDLKAQSSSYQITTGDKKERLNWNVETRNGLIYLHTSQGSRNNEYILKSNYQTVLWKSKDEVHGHDFSISLQNGVYRLTGTFKSKPISKTYASKDSPWYQNIAFNVGHSLKDSPEMKFECFRPDNLDLHVMEAKKTGKEEIRGVPTIGIKVNAAGFLSKFWSCMYYVSEKNGNFIQYRGVNGGPGTPETVILKIEPTAGTEPDQKQQSNSSLPL